MPLTKIVSGGQTGVDRGALDAALAAKFPCGGWCPSDRRAEDGSIPPEYPVTPLKGSGYRERTVKNVIDSDGTAILFYGSLTGGTKLTRDICVRQKKPFVVLDAKQITESAASAAIVHFLEQKEIAVLNVAGPRLSGWPNGHQFALVVVGEVIERRGDKDGQRWGDRNRDCRSNHP
jgi:hypothetical protein